MVEAISPVRKYVPKGLDCADWQQIEPVVVKLLDRELNSLTDFEQWLADNSELQAVLSEYASRRNIDFACHTDDKEIESAYMHYVEKIAPKLQPLQDQFHRKYLESPYRSQLTDSKFELLTRDWQASVDLFRDENIPLQVEDAKLNKEYDQTIGAMTVDYDGETYTLQQIGRFLEDTDRSVREETWALSSNRRLDDRGKIDDIFEKMLQNRSKIAANADCENYREYLWKSWCRFDYTPQHCHEFADAVEKSIVPLMKKLHQERANQLNIDVLRPWDSSVDPLGRSPLMPFDKSDVQRLVSGCKTIFSKIEVPLAADYDMLKMGRNLDLDSRIGKRAGGFQASLPESKQPFIFMNAAGLQRDVETMLHEAGHAFHYIWAAESEPLVFLQHAPLEFCEVASMSMELFASPYLSEFYPNQADADRARRKHLEGILSVLPWIATIDQFQHWLYTNEGHSLEQRTQAWRDILARFSTGLIDYTGFEEARDARWHAQLHLFHVPFYYIEYGIAQLGALQLYNIYRQDPATALSLYRKALTLGGTRPLPELFAAAGISFDFSLKTIQPLIDTLEQELATLPA
ncbi:Peptidase family M3 [Poriferisphaera corsica]|uniref:Peptidase family M3 n=1 Tax=Poriferisphaera corsica TaxID=2528020 RepID=A0A517YY22_9BACT|nr:M3 family oligoendopeptidase [Poriferisphaera corsica]QDU35133.1 Peptidase family M3 [Poriferisphaera corsica]